MPEKCGEQRTLIDIKELRGTESRVEIGADATRLSGSQLQRVQ